MQTNRVLLFKQLSDASVRGFGSAHHCKQGCPSVPRKHWQRRKRAADLTWQIFQYERQTADVRWMALRRGMRVGLLGGDELVLWRLRLLSMEGEA